MDKKIYTCIKNDYIVRVGNKDNNEDDVMKYYNLTTHKTDEISYIIDGCDALPDICLCDFGHGTIAINGEVIPKATASDVEWWNSYIHADEEARAMLSLAMDEDGMTQEEMQEIISQAASETFLEDQPRLILQKIAEWKQGREA